MTYCPAKDYEAARMKRVKEKSKKWNALDYKKTNSKSRNLFSVPFEIETRISASKDKSFESVGVGRFRKVY